MKNFIKLSIAALIGIGSISSAVLTARSTSITEESASAAQHIDGYDDFFYSGSYYNDINFSAGNGLNGNLRKALTTLIKPSRYLDYYDDLSYELQRADQDPTNSSNMVYFYSRNSVKKSAAGGNKWNREHVWPQSLSNNLWGQDYAGADMLHLRPTYSTTNSNRSNYRFKNVSANWDKYNGYPYAKINGGYFEPLDAVKGDCARIIMYVWTAWLDFYGASKMPAITKVFDSYNTMLEWHLIDPPDELEANRNDRAYTVQSNRNPYVDHPELGWKIFGEKCSSSLVAKAKNVYPETNVEVTSLSYTGSPSKTSYIDGEEFNANGIKVTAKMSDGTSKDVTNDVLWKKVNINESYAVGYYGRKSVKVSGINISSFILATKISFANNKIEGKVGDTVQLEIVFSPSNSTDKNITYTSTDTKVAKVDNNGLLTLVGEGKTAIVARAPESGLSAVCDIVVTGNKGSSANGSGCTGSIVTSSVIISIISLFSLTFFVMKKRKSI